jgi:proteasome lid subunit RPN8/RPN11
MKGVLPVKRKRKNKLIREPPKLRFTPTAWAKLLFLRDVGDTEVGAFGICPTDQLLVEDVQLVTQTCTWSTVSFDDESVADFFEDQVENGLQPDQFARVWIHTHPGESAEPSFTDEETFARVFGRTDWAVMSILACGGEAYARMRVDAGSAELLLETEIDFTVPFPSSKCEDWESEYSDCVVEQQVSSRLDDVWFLMDYGSENLAFDPSEIEGDLDDQLLLRNMEEELYDEYYQSSQSLEH